VTSALSTFSCLDRTTPLRPDRTLAGAGVWQRVRRTRRTERAVLLAPLVAQHEPDVAEPLRGHGVFVMSASPARNRCSRRCRGQTLCKRPAVGTRPDSGSVGLVCASGARAGTSRARRPSLHTTPCPRLRPESCHASSRDVRRRRASVEVRVVVCTASRSTVAHALRPPTATLHHQRHGFVLFTQVAVTNGARIKSMIVGSISCAGTQQATSLVQRLRALLPFPPGQCCRTVRGRSPCLTETDSALALDVVPTRRPLCPSG